MSDRMIALRVFARVARATLIGDLLARQLSAPSLRSINAP